MRPKTKSTFGAFHVVKWAGDALDQVRRDTWNAVRERRRHGHQSARGEGKVLNDSRWSLWKKPDNLNDAERARLDYIAVTHPQLH